MTKYERVQFLIHLLEFSSHLLGLKLQNISRKLLEEIAEELDFRQLQVAFAKNKIQDLAKGLAGLVAYLTFDLYPTSYNVSDEEVREALKTLQQFNEEIPVEPVTFYIPKVIPAEGYLSHVIHSPRFVIATKGLRDAAVLLAGRSVFPGEVKAILQVQIHPKFVIGKIEDFIEAFKPFTKFENLEDELGVDFEAAYNDCELYKDCYLVDTFCVGVHDELYVFPKHPARLN